MLRNEMFHREYEAGSEGLMTGYEILLRNPRTPKEALPVIGESIERLAKKEILTQEQAHRLLDFIPQEEVEPIEVFRA